MAGDTAVVMDFVLDRVPVAEETQRLETQLVYTASVTAKRVSRVLQFAAKRLPKLEGIEHVKRVKRIAVNPEDPCRNPGLLQVVLCQCSKITRAQLDATVEADAELQMSAAKEEEDGTLRITTHRVPSTAPCTRAQFDEWRALWPVAYRPLSQLKPPVFGAQERAYVCRSLELVVQMCEESRVLGTQCAEFVVVANPVTQADVAQSADRTAVDRHPLRHAVMCCIAMVAETETKKVLTDCDESIKGKIQPSDAATTTTATDPLSSLVPAKRSASSAVSNNEDALSSSDGGYLCEGLDVFASREPCTMCCMALVHSRIGRLFFIEPRREDGGISYHSIHSLKALNHHFTAFQCTQAK
ncbi:tRNA-specific adenosine deaminase subunit tad3 [Coemansia sp. RSA 1200]|nr:tRNA-specific adenosine deaminase subunit tad3 [Coemansia sp. RSA 1200]